MKKNLIVLLTASLLVFSAQTTFAENDEVMNGKQSISQSAEDAVITAAVKKAFAKDNRLSSLLNIKVITHNKKVYIIGEVDSESEAEQLIAVASSVSNVASVDADGLDVKGSQHLTKDLIISAEIRGLYLREAMMSKSFSASKIDKIETNNLVVYLTVSDKESENTKIAVALAKSVSGVKDVQLLESGERKP